MTVRQIDHARVEARIGRRLTAAERHIDVETIDALLNQAKDFLDAEIRREQARLAALVAAGHGGRLEVTPRMVAILADLRKHGRAHALNELASMGYPVRANERRFAVPAQPPDEPPPPRPHLVVLSDSILEGRLRTRLGELTIKVQTEAVGLDLSSMSVAAIEKALIDVLGARSIAADLVAPAFSAGLGDTFAAHQDLIDGWEYSAVMDGASTCDPCAELDGTTYATTADLMEVLPDFGGNPDCDGGTRCRCRAIPLPAGG